MGATLFKEVSYSLAKLISDIDMGEIGLPEMQRPFVWPNTKVRDLFDSMFRGFPVGYLLFWVNGAESGHRQIGAGEKQKIPRLLIVDGQQRLTSLYAVLKGKSVVRDDHQEERIRIAFRPRDCKFEVSDAAIASDPEYISDISELWAGKTTRNRFVKDFVSRLRQSRHLDDDEEDRITECIDQLYDLQNYPFTALELSGTVSEEDVAEVFVRINSRGTPLNQANFILTLMSVFWDQGRAELEEFCRQARKPPVDGPSPFNYFIQPDPDQLLRVDVGLGFRRARLQHVYSILRGKDLDTGEFSESRRVQQFAVLERSQRYVLDLQSWHDFLKTLLRAGYRAAWMITSQNALLYSYVLYLVGKHNFGVDGYALRGVIARWFFMSALTGRYTGSFETVMEQDLNRLRDATGPEGFICTLDKVVRDTLTDDYWNITLPNDLSTSSPRTPSLYAYYASLSLLGAKMLFSKVKVSELLDPANKGRKSAVERHHLYPRSYLVSLGYDERRDVNQVANFALVEWDDNIRISDEPPSRYFPKYARRITPQEMQQMRYWHALPQGWENMEYRRFLEERRKAIARVVRDGYQELWN